MTKPDQRTLEALRSLRGDARFDRVLEWIGASLEVSRSAIATQRDELLVRWAQGEMQALSDILGALKASRQDAADKPRRAAESPY